MIGPIIACEQALLGVGGGGGAVGGKRRELATMSQEFECRPQYSPRLPAVLAVRMWPISANQKR